jgi:hypothetical protein
MFTQEAIDKLENYNTELTLDDRGAIAELLGEFELFRQHVIFKVREVEAVAHTLKRV